MNAEIIPATLKHAQFIALNCRHDDIQEFAALGITPFDAMRHGLNSHGFAYTGMIDDEPACMFGVSDASIIGCVGRPWMVATSVIEKHQKAFLRRNKPFVQMWAGMYSLLINHVDVRNTQAIKWLKWLGFEFHPAEPAGIYGLPFYRFTMKGV